MNKEEQEFNEFMAKFQHKANEIQKDFNNLSDNNKAKVMEVMLNLVWTKGFAEFINGIGNYKNY